MFSDDPAHFHRATLPNFTWERNGSDCTTETSSDSLEIDVRIKVHKEHGVTQVVVMGYLSDEQIDEAAEALRSIKGLRNRP